MPPPARAKERRSSTATTVLASAIGAPSGVKTVTSLASVTDVVNATQAARLADSSSCSACLAAGCQGSLSTQQTVIDGGGPSDTFDLLRDHEAIYTQLAATQTSDPQQHRPAKRANDVSSQLHLDGSRKPDFPVNELLGANLQSVDELLLGGWATQNSRMPSSSSWPTQGGKRATRYAAASGTSSYAVLHPSSQFPTHVRRIASPARVGVDWHASPYPAVFATPLYRSPVVVVPPSGEKQLREEHGLVCEASGPGLSMAKCRQLASFTLKLTKPEGGQVNVGSDAIQVAIRGASRTRAKVISNGDDTFTVEYKASVSGQYYISVCVFGFSISGSPFTLAVVTPRPVASQCEVSGNALTQAVSRMPQVFEVRFRDALGELAHAEELDVYVEPIEEGDGESDDGIHTPTSPPSPSSPSSPLGTSRVHSYRGSRVEVGTKPLVVRAGPGLDTELIGQLPPAQLISVIDERTMSDGSVRALVSLVDPEAGRYAVEESWWKPGVDPEEEMASVLIENDPSVKKQLLPGSLAGLLDVGPSPRSFSPRGLDVVPEAYESWYGDTGDGASEISSLLSPSIASLLAPASSNRRQHARGKPMTPHGHRVALRRLGIEAPDSPTRNTDASLLSQRSQTGPSARSLASLSSAQQSQRSRGNASDRRRTRNTSPTRNARSLAGWVTIKKSGVELVNRRERLDATRRQHHMEQWARRLRSDRTAAATETVKKVRATETRKHGMGGMGKAEQGLHRSDVFADEKTSDPTGIGFAFGGMDPGTVRAKGQLHAVHKVSYSIGLVGRFYLHVALRHQALPLPGSPWTLVVVPGAAHADSSTLAVGQQPVQGSVGLTGDAGCTMRLTASDKMKNRCTEGGAKILATCKNESVEGTWKDFADGTYDVSFRSKASGMYTCEVLIGSSHVIGSPFTIELRSTQPSIPETRIFIDGDQVAGFSNSAPAKPDLFSVADAKSMQKYDARSIRATAGAMSSILFSFCDEYGNVAVPDQHCFTLSTALVPESDDTKPERVTEYKNRGAWSTKEKGQYSMELVPGTLWDPGRKIQSGKMKLHLWCHPSQGSDRVFFTGSPFSILVDPNVMEAEKSSVGRMKFKNDEDEHEHLNEDESLRKMINAGDTVIFRPELRDCCDNFARIGNSRIAITVEVPQGDALKASIPLPSTAPGAKSALLVKADVKGGLTKYEIRHTTLYAGEHRISVVLDGKHIMGSPFTYSVAPAHYEIFKTILEPLSGPGAPENMFVDKPYTILARLRDRFGNFLDRGGAKAYAKLEHMKQGLYDSTILSPSNHETRVEDQHDGTYLIHLRFITAGNGLNYFPIKFQMYFILGEGEEGEFNAGRHQDQCPPVPLKCIKDVNAAPGSFNKDKPSMRKSKSAKDVPNSQSSEASLLVEVPAGDDDVAAPAAAPAAAPILVGKAVKRQGTSSRMPQGSVNATGSRGSNAPISATGSRGSNAPISATGSRGSDTPSSPGATRSRGSNAPQAFASATGSKGSNASFGSDKK